MKSLKRLSTLLLAIALTAWGAGMAAAYTRIATTTGESPRWFSMPIPYWIHAAGSPQIHNGSEFHAIHSGFAAWQNVTSANIVFNYHGTTTAATAGLDGMNVVTFVDEVNPLGSTTLAATFLFFSLDGEHGEWRINEADIAFNPLRPFSTSLEEGRYDIQSVLTHEVGHLLGLDHSGLLSSVMAPFAAHSQANQRTLMYDDVAGVTEIYPGPLPATGRIRGVVTLDGAPVFGAHVVALDAQGTPLVSAVSQPDGGYTLGFLPPGTYRVYAEPLDGPVTRAHLGGQRGWYGGITDEFGATYFGNTAMLEQAAAVVVAAGESSEADIQALPRSPSNLNLSSPSIAPRVPRNVAGTLAVSGTDLTSGATFSASSGHILVGAPTFGGETPAGPTSAAVPLTLLASTPFGPKNIAVHRTPTETSILSGLIVIVDDPPEIDGILPANGPATGQTTVRIDGNHFAPGVRVYFGGLPSANVQRINARTILAVAPANPAGVVNVTAINPDGGHGVAAVAYAYDHPQPSFAPPVVYSGSVTDSTSVLSASWIPDGAQVGIVEYHYAIGTSPGASDVRAFTATTATHATTTGLSLVHGRTYYVAVRAVSGDGFVSAVGVSGGTLVDTGFVPYSHVVPYAVHGGGRFSGIALLAPEAAWVRLTAHNVNGALAGGVNPRTITLAAGQQYARMVNELFDIPSFNGWIEIESSAAELGVYFTVGSSSLGEMDGALPGRLSSDFAVLRSGATLVLVNPGDEHAEVTLESYASGATAHWTAPAGGRTSIPITAPTRIRSSRPLAAVELLQSGNSLALAVPESLSEAREAITFAHGASGGGYSTRLMLLNTRPYRTEAHIRFGEESKSLLLEGDAVVEVTLHDLLNLPDNKLRTGAVHITARATLFGAPHILAALDIATPSSTAALSALPAVTETYLAHVAQGAGLFTGVAIAAGEEAATVTMDVYPGTGGQPQSVTFAVGANQQLANLIHEFAPAVTFQIGGYIRIRSDRPVWVWGIFGTDGMMASMPPL